MNKTLFKIYINNTVSKSLKSHPKCNCFEIWFNLKVGENVVKTTPQPSFTVVWVWSRRLGGGCEPPRTATVLMSGHSHFIFRPLFSQHQCDSPTGYPVNRRHVSNTCWGTRDWKLTAPLCMRIFRPSSSTNISDKSTQLWVDKYTVCKFQVHYYYLH